MRMILGREVRDEKHFVDYKIVLVKHPRAMWSANGLMRYRIPYQATVAGPAGPVVTQPKGFYTGAPADTVPLPRNWLFLGVP